MKIKLVNFKCYLNEEIEIIDNKITLISGSSGAGKSSILQSIYWCLYGGLRGVYNNKTTGKCSVTVMMNGCVIYRQARPNLLTIKFDNGKYYEDTVAQQIIDSSYGQKDLWYACSYIAQDTRCLLLTGTNTERMNLLNDLSFVDDDPEECINRIDVELKSMQKLFITQQTEYEAELKLFITDVNRDPTVFKYSLSLDAIIEKENQLLHDHTLYKELQITKNNQNKLLGKISYIQSNIQAKKNELNLTKKLQNTTVLSDPVDYDQLIHKLQEKKQATQTEHTKKKDEISSNISILENQLTDINLEISNHLKNKDLIINTYNYNINELNRLNKNIDSIKQSIENYNKHKDMLQKSVEDKKLKNNLDDANFSNQDLWNTQKLENKYELMKKKSEELLIEYNQDIIQSTKSQLNQQLQFLSKMEQESKIKSTVDKLKFNLELYKDVQQIPIEKIVEATKKYHDYQQGLNLLVCPHCKGSLNLQGSTLIPSHLHKVDSNEIDNIKSKIEGYEQINKNYSEKINIEKQIESLNKLITIESPFTFDQIITEKNKCETTLNKLAKLDYVEPPKHTSTSISNYLEYKKSKHTYDNFIKSFNVEKAKTELQNTQLKLIDVQTDCNKLKIQKESITENSEITIKRDRLQTELNKYKQIKKQCEYDYTNLIQKYTNQEIEYSRKKSSYEIEKNNFMALVEKVNKIKEEIVTLEKEETENINLLIPDIDEKLAECIKRTQDTKIHIQNARICQVFYERQTILNTKRDAIMEMHHNLTALGTIRQIAIDLECEQLQSTVDRINNIMNEILENIFEQPITVTLKLYKKIKSNKRIKPSVNLVVSYKGVDYDGVKMLSGGESDRISLALVVAMNRISSSPFLFLDESLRSINDSLRSHSIKSIREVLYGMKTIVCINHEDTEGHYDRVINIQKDIMIE